MHRKSCLHFSLHQYSCGLSTRKGRPFAWQEAHIALARVLQKFDIVMDDPSYTLQLKQTMAMKPKGFYIHAIPRKRMSVPVAVSLSGPLAGATNGTRKSSSEASEENAEPKQKLYIVYGSNTGTSQTFAQRIASDAPSHGVSGISRRGGRNSRAEPRHRLQGQTWNFGLYLGACAHRRPPDHCHGILRR